MECPHRPACPGCRWFERPYDEQLRAKFDAVRHALAAWPALRTVPIDGCLPAEPREGYRTRVKWVVEGARIGLYGPNHTVVDTPACRVAPATALALAALLRRRPPEPSEARLGALDVRVTAEGRAVATLVVEGRDRDVAGRHAAALADWLLREAGPELVGVAWGFRAEGAPTTLGGRPIGLRGETTVLDRVGRLETLFPPGAFTQAHARQTARLQELVRAALADLPAHESLHLVDLYAGVGTFGLALADLVRETTLVEAFVDAADASRASARRLGRQVRVLGVPSEQALGEMPDDIGPLAVVVDPPRTGLAGVVLRVLALRQPALVAYVSCAPQTMARDLAVLANHGLVAERVTPVDMMPGTDQVEALALLRPGRPTPLVVVAEGPDWLVADKPAFLPTMPHPEWPTSLLARVQERRPTLQAVHRLDEGTSGLILFRTATADDPLADADKLYLAVVRGVTHKRGTIAAPLNERGTIRAARTTYRRLEVVGGHSLVEVTLETARPHQIRRHFAEVGHPVLGDERYGDPRTNRYVSARHGLVRPFLHATRLTVPGLGRFESALAPDLTLVMASLRGTGEADDE